jgi:cytochrome bd ubiquinol oxidase subunit II
VGTVWFVVIVLMLIAYVVLDGFDFGAGIIHPFVARTDEERRTVLAAIGPVWDGNEVWLIAGGGVSFFAFPRAYAVGFSGFYLPLIIVLWLLIMRGLSIEVRSKEANPLWRSFWDGTFFVSSTLMAVVLGAALGNLVRGVPIDASGYFSSPLFKDFRVGPDPGVLDWYTVCVGMFAVAMLAVHGSLYLVWKTDGVVRERSRALAERLWWIIVLLAVIVTVATFWVQPIIIRHLRVRPFVWPLGLMVIGSMAGVFIFHRRRRELPAFLASVFVIAGLLGITAATVYPNILMSSRSPAYSLTVLNAAAAPVTLRVGLIWWVIAIALAIGYFVYLFSAFAGKVKADRDGYGH